MPTYVSLLNWTEQGIKNFRDTRQRADDFTNVVEKAGGKVSELVWTIGEYDLVCVFDLPDDETLAATLLRLGEKGNVRTKTMRAFSASQMGKVLDKAG